LFISRAAKIIPRIFRIMDTSVVTAQHLAGDGPSPVRARSGLALGFWPECPQPLQGQACLRVMTGAFPPVLVA